MVARFVTGHPGAVRRVFRDVLMIAAQGDLIGGEVFALDGCKISSNAAREHSGTQRELKKKVAKLEARLEAMLLIAIPMSSMNLMTMSRTDRVRQAQSAIEHGSTGSRDSLIPIRRALAPAGAR